MNTLKCCLVNLLENACQPRDWGKISQNRVENFDSKAVSFISHFLNRKRNSLIFDLSFFLSFFFSLFQNGYKSSYRKLKRSFIKLVEKITISANPVFILKHIDDTFQTHLCLLSSMSNCETVLFHSFIMFLLNPSNNV